MAATILVQIGNSGGNVVIDGEALQSSEVVVEFFSAGATLANDFHFEINPPAPDGTIINYILVLNTPFDLNGHTFDIDGVFFTQDLIDVGYPYWGRKYYGPQGYGGTVWSGDNLFYGYLNPALLPDSGLTLAKFPNLTRGSILLGNSSNRPAAFDAKTSGQILIGNGTDLTSVAVTGDVTITSGGVTSIGAGVIVNADINASAAIALSKLAALTASKPVVTNGSGVLTTANQISPAFGGTGQDFSASTGFATAAAGTFSVGAISETIQLQVSFESGYQGDFKIKMPYAGTVTGIYAYAIKAIAGTDNGTIVAKNNGGTTMTDGTITYTASDARGTAYTVSPSANNTFAAGDLLTFTTAKVTAGGVVQLSITVTRNN